MNENIGAKGGTNDRRKTLIIKTNQKQQELKQLEKSVEKKQLMTLFTAVPLVISGVVLKPLLNIETKEQESRLILPKSSEEDTKKERYIYQNDDNEMVEIEFTTKKYQGKTIYSIHAEEKDVLAKETGNFKVKNSIDDKNNKEQPTKIKVLKVEQNSIPILTTDEVNEEKEILIVSETQELEKLKSKKIITEYEKMLKDVRSELRNVIFDYNVITKETNEVYSKKDSEQLVERLNLIIKKIEELKERIKITDFDKYDDNYLYVLIEEYLEEFKEKKLIEEIKDSTLYVSIASKLEELNEKKDKLKEAIETRKEKLEIDEKSFENLREKYTDFEQMNHKLLKFQNDQDALLKELDIKLKEATTVQEQAEYKIATTTKQSNNLLKAIALQMMIPGARSAKSLVAMTALSLHFIRSMFNQNLNKRKYKTIKVSDYSKEIEKSISSIDDITELLGKTTREIDRTINDFKKEYKEYFGIIKECDELLENLEQVKDEIKEKEFELNKIKEVQEKNLERNNAKVKVLNENTL